MNNIIKILSILFISIIFSCNNYIYHSCISRKNIKPYKKLFYNNTNLNLLKIEPYLTSDNCCSGMYFFYYKFNFQIELVIPGLKFKNKIYLYNDNDISDNFKLFKSENKDCIDSINMIKIEESFIKGIAMSVTK